MFGRFAFGAKKAHVLVPAMIIGNNEHILKMAKYRTFERPRQVGVYQSARARRLVAAARVWQVRRVGLLAVLAAMRQALGDVQRHV